MVRENHMMHSRARGKQGKFSEFSRNNSLKNISFRREHIVIRPARERKLACPALSRQISACDRQQSFIVQNYVLATGKAPMCNSC